jgi:hypothetical protein
VVLEHTKALAAALLLSIACGGGTSAAPIGTIPPPVRTAAADDDLRRLLLEVAESKLCEALRGSFVPLPGDGEAEGAEGTGAGRLWVEECDAGQHNDRLELRISGRGWTWVEQSSDGPLGTSFTVRGHLRFTMSFELSGRMDVAYASDSKIVSLWVTPDSPASGSITPTGAVPVAPDGGWSSFVGALGGVFGGSIEERARPIVEEHGSRRLRERMTGGFTFTADLCTGQTDSVVGPLPNGVVPARPWPSVGRPSLANQRMRLRAGGIDAAGPFRADAPLRVDVQVEEGAGIEIQAYCEEDARRVVTAFLEEAPAPSTRPRLRHRALRGEPSFVELDASECALVLITTPLGPAGSEVLYRYRVDDTGAEAPDLITCE